MARKQQKLLGFGPRWQTADPTVSLTREHEVQQALQQLDEVYRKQRQVQDQGNAECAADFQAAKRRAVLTRRRGQAVESFGKREEGEWVLHPEEMLYLAERGTLAVFEEAEGGDKRRLTMPELYGKVLSSPVHLNPDSYTVYSHLRRSGYTVTRSGEEADLPQRSWRVVSTEGPAEVMVVRPEEPVLPCLLGQTECSGWEGQVDALHSRIAKALGVAVSATAEGSPAFLELVAPRRPGEDGGTVPVGVAAASSASEEASDEEAGSKPAEAKALPPAARESEEVLEPRERYAAMLRRVSQISTQTPDMQERGSKAKSSKSKDTQDAWTL